MEDIRKGVCPMCQHNEIIQAWPAGQPYLKGEHPLSAAHGKMNRWNGAVPLFGAMTAYICRRCGHTQWATASPEIIPIGDEFQTRLLKGPEPEGPFR
jgi:rubrerythrin